MINKYLFGFRMCIIFWIVVFGFGRCLMMWVFIIRLKCVFGYGKV